MSRIRANKITNKAGTGAIELEKGAHIPVGMGLTGAGAINLSGAITGGVITGSSFSGDGSGLIGVASTDNIITGTAATFNTMPVDINAGMTVAGVSTFAAITATSFGAVSGTTGTFSGSVSIGGTLTYEDVINVDSVGIVTARAGIKMTGGSLYVGGNSNFTGTLTGTASTATLATNVTVSANNSTNETVYPVFVDGATGTQGAETDTGLTYNPSTGNLTSTKFTGDGSGLTGLPGITTNAQTVTNGNTLLLDLSKDDHKVTATGTVTISCTGGTEGDSHTVRIVNSGIATVGFSTYFLFPSGGTPSIPTTTGTISLITFTVHQAGSSGISTQLLGGASVNFS